MNKDKIMARAQVLVVEDEGIVARDLQNSLTRLGYAVPAIASSGEESLQRVEATPPDVVMMDIKLKGMMDGIEAAEQIRARFNIPVIYLTAYADETTLQRAKVTEPFGYILKPFEERELHTIIEITLYRHRMEMERERLLTELREALANVKVLRGLLPICASCKKIRDDKGYWEQIEVYIRDHSDADFTHGLCPDCIKKFYPDIYERRPE
jgi:CheY-like chemotaxis protein